MENEFKNDVVDEPKEEPQEKSQEESQVESQVELTNVVEEPQASPEEAPIDLEKNVVIPRDKFERLLDRIERLEFSADKGRLSNYDQRNQKVSAKKLRVRKFHGKYVTGWTLTKNSIEERAGAWFEDQRLTIKYADGTEEENVALVDFERNFTYEDAVVENETVDKGIVWFDVTTTETQTQLTLADTFIN